MRPLLLGALVVWLAACGPARTRPPVVINAATYPFSLRAPSELSQDFLVRQTVSVKVHADPTGKEHTVEVVLQKQGSKLLVVGLGPMNTKLFVVEYDGQGITTQSQLHPMPVDPYALVVDIERVYYARLPTSSSGPSGHMEGMVGGESVSEDWAAGMLQKRTFRRASYDEPITVDFAPGCTPTRCDPKRVVLRNAWLGYDVTIVSEGREELERP